jgi:hypothetical protein
MILLEKFIPDSYADRLEHTICETDFAWKFNSSTISKTVEHNNQNVGNFQFFHPLYINEEIVSDTWSLVRPLLYFVEDKTNLRVIKLHRVKINLLTNSNITEHEQERTLHSDVLEKEYNQSYFSMIYYVIDSDGDTVLKYPDQDNRVPPKKGRAVIFPSNIHHFGLPPKSHKRRMVINFVFQAQQVN